MKTLLLALALLVLFTLIVCADTEQMPLPKYPERTAESLYQQLGLCNADLSDTRKYMQALAQEIEKRDKEIADLKAQLAKDTKPDAK